MPVSSSKWAHYVSRNKRLSNSPRIPCHTLPTRSNETPECNKIAKPTSRACGKECQALAGNGQLDVEMPLEFDRKPVDDPPSRIDDAGNAGVGGAHQRHPALHGSHLRLPKMLVGTRRVPEPRIVGDVDDNPQVT